MITRQEHDQFERDWWGNCVNTFAEEVKQLTYANRMGLVNVGVDGGYWPVYDIQGKSIVDIGGGPVSMLLKAVEHQRSAVVDPCDYPEWITDRYLDAGILFSKHRGEDITIDHYLCDEVWIYNVLQHTDSPETIIDNARLMAKTIRIFEWIDIPPYLGHPQELKAHLLDDWLCGQGTVEDMNENGCVGKAYYGVFSGY